MPEAHVVVRPMARAVARSRWLYRGPQLHRWSSGRIHRCHRCDPGSIPGRCMLFGKGKSSVTMSQSESDSSRKVTESTRIIIAAGHRHARRNCKPHLCWLPKDRQLHRWSSGRIHRCHRCGPGSIPGRCIPRWQCVPFRFCGGVSGA